MPRTSKGGARRNNDTKKGQKRKPSATKKKLGHKVAGKLRRSR